MSSSAVTKCITCGASVESAEKYCSSCGSPMAQGTTPIRYCSRCGQPTGQRPFCSNCGLATAAYAGNTSLNLPVVSVPRVSFDPTFSAFPPYYREEFRRIYESGENYKGKWNWAGFLFGAIWALTKGLWLPSLIAFVGASPYKRSSGN